MNQPASPRTIISFLWVFISFNMVFADVLSLYTPGVLPQVMTGVVEGVTLSEPLMLVAAVFIQIPILMSVVTQIAPAQLCKITNLAAVVLTAAFVIGGGSLKLHYLFFAAGEIIAMLAIVRLVLKQDAARG